MRGMVGAGVLFLAGSGIALPAEPAARQTEVRAAHRRDLEPQIASLVDQRLGEWVALYKELHAAPELSLREEQTAARLAELWEAAGLAVTPNVGGHGVVAVLANGEGPTLLIRTDMDALPVVEETGLPYASRVRVELDDGSHVGVMHACGHDVHMTVAVAAAQVLAALKDRWRGTAVFIGQPAEEVGRGARMMIAAGLFERFPKPDYCTAEHVAHDLPAGVVGVYAGYVNANVDSVDITIYGRGGHGAHPHLSEDPIVAAAQVIVGLQTLVSRRVKPTAPAVVTVGSVHAGTKHNIIPEVARLQLTVRSYNDEVRRQLLDGIRQVTADTCRAMGCSRPPEVLVSEEEYTPAAYNDPALTAAAKAVFEQALGSDRVVDKPPEMGGEDFGTYSRTLGVPGFMFRVGVVSAEDYAASQTPGGPKLPPAHSSRFAPRPEPTIRTAVHAMTALACSMLGAP